MKTFHHCMLVLGPLFLAACTSMPDAQIQYYLPQAETTITVTQTVDCDPGKTRLIFNQSVASPATAYSADPTRLVQPVRIKGLDGSFSDSSASFTFYDDGRLKGINASSTGQGATIIKSAVTLATTLGSIAVKGGKPTSNPCAIVQKFGGGKPLTLTYQKILTKPNFVSAQSGVINIAPGDASAYNSLKDSLPELTLSISPVPMGELVLKPSDTGEVVLFPVTKTTNLGLLVQATLAGKSTDIWSGNVVVPSNGSYDVPVAKPNLFGKTSFVLALNDAGLVTTLTYGKDSGASDALTAADSVATAVKPESSADRAAELKGQADLIVQQQRLARCKANPATCS